VSPKHDSDPFDRERKAHADAPHEHMRLILEGALL